MINACVRANAQYEPLRPGQLHCAIIGAGATGVELMAELHKTMRDLASCGLDNIDFDKLIKLTIIESGPRILGPLQNPGRDELPAFVVGHGLDVDLARLRPHIAPSRKR